MNNRRDFLKRTVSLGGAGLVMTPNISAGAFESQQLQGLQGRVLDAVADFGCDNTGASNTTKKLKAFYDACIASGANGLIPAGVYLITEGQLVFETPFVDKPWPNIFTAGHQFVFFKFAGVADAPLLTWSNGNANSIVGKYWIGGCHGGISFVGANKPGYTQSHAISITGIWGLNFGWLKGSGLSGDLVHLPKRRFEKNNPDPYACTYLEFDGLEANHCLGKVVDNRNSLGLAHWKVKRLRATNGKGGVWFGLGSGVEIESVSIGSCAGWAFEDSSIQDDLDGPSLRFYVSNAELDDVEFGFRINRLSMFELKGIRFVHRFKFSALNMTECYWPRIAFDFAGGAKASVTCGKVNCVHRVEGGSAKAKLGTLLSGNNNAGFSNCQIDQVVNDQAGFDFADHELYTNINSASTVLLTKSGRTIYDMRERTVVVARGSVEKTIIGFEGFGSLNSRVHFPQRASVNVSQTVRCYDNRNSVFTAPYFGMYQIDVNIPLRLPVGTRVRIGIANEQKLIANTIDYARTNEIQHYHLREILQLHQGDEIFVVAEQGTERKTHAAVAFSKDEIGFFIVAL